MATINVTLFVNVKTRRVFSTKPKGESVIQKVHQIGLIFSILISCLIQLIAHPAIAQASQSAHELYQQGDFKQASLKAEAQDSPEGYSLALRAALAYGGHVARGKEAVEWLERAQRLSDKLMSLDNKSFRNRLSAAIVISYRSKKQRSVSLVNRAKHLIEGLIQDYPDEAMAYGALAGWHSEISAAGFLPRLILGASRRKAGQYFEKARSFNDTKLSLNLEYAKYLARGRESERNQSKELLLSIVKIDPKDAFDRLLQENANKLLKAVNMGKKKAIKHIIAEISAFQDF